MYDETTKLQFNPKGKKSIKKKNTFLPFLFLAVIASILALYLKRTVDQERKQDKIEEVRWLEEEVLSDGVYQYDAKSHTFSRCENLCVCHVCEKVPQWFNRPVSQ